MTIIAASIDYGQMACDTQGSGDGCAQDFGSKIVRVEQVDGGLLLLGFAGSYGVGRWARSLRKTEVYSLDSAEALWMEYVAGAREAGGKPAADHPGGALMLVRINHGGREGEVLLFHCEGNGTVLIPYERYAAEGCGRQVALGALHAAKGAPAAAVAAAIDHSVWCGGRVHLETVWGS